MAKNGAWANGRQHWMALEGGADTGADGGGPHISGFAAIGALVPERRVTSDELMASTKHRTHIDLERLTGIHEHHVVAEGEDSYTLAAARDALEHWDGAAEDLDMLIVTSITRHVGGLRSQLEPPVSVALKEALGAPHAMSFDLTNACAGMLTGVFIFTELERLPDGELAHGRLGAFERPRCVWLGDLDGGEVDLLVANASDPDFAEALAGRLGLSSEPVASPHDGLARAHTDAPAVALESVRLEAGRTALFVSAGAGITVAVALYRG